MKIINFKTIFAAIFIISILFLDACKKDEVLLTNNKEIVIWDSLKLNSITLKISSAQPELLNSYSQGNFKLIVLSPEQLQKKISLEKNIVKTEEVIEDENFDIESEPVTGKIFFEIINENFVIENSPFSINVNHIDTINAKGGFQESAWSSTRDNFSITRTNWWHRVYYKYDAKYNGSFEPVIPSYKKLPFKEVKTHYEPNSEAIRVYVKYKKESHFDLTFFN